MMIVNEEIAIKICEQMKDDIDNLCDCCRKDEKNRTCIGCRELAIETILKENTRLKEIENKLMFIKNRVKQGMSQENINKCAIKLINSYLKEN